MFSTPSFTLFSPVLEAPGIRGAFCACSCFVVKVCALESDANFQGGFERLHCNLWLHLKHLGAVDKLNGLPDELVADLSHQDHQPARRVVEFRVAPDEEDRVHKRLEMLADFPEINGELAEEVFNRFEVEHVVV